MSKSDFGLIIVLLAIIYLFKERIAYLINLKLLRGNRFHFRIHTKYISYTLFVILIITLILGMLITSEVQTKFGNVEQGFENLAPKNKPHPWFNINFDIFKF